MEVLEDKKIKIIQKVLVFVLVSVLIGCATGSYIVTGKARPAISPDDVKIYSAQPSQYEKIGMVEAFSDVGFSSQKAVDRAVKELKKQASKIGANGVLLTDMGSIGIDTSYYSKTVKGDAIFVIQE